MATSNEALREKVFGGFVFRVIADPDPVDLRADDPVTRIVTWTRRLVVGDEHDFEDPDAFLASVQPDDIVLPLYVHDHSGISLALGPFNDRWDSGQAGYVLVTSEKLRAIGVDPADTERVGEIVAGEVGEQQRYLNGECYQVDAHQTVTEGVIERPIQVRPGVYDCQDATLDEAVVEMLHDLDYGRFGDVKVAVIAATPWTGRW